MQKALEAIKAKRENEKGWAEAESCSNLAAALYSDDMPPEYMDSVPDDISMLVFQKQLSHSLDTLKLTASDSVSFRKLAGGKLTSCNVPIPWNDRVYRSMCFFARSKKGSLDKWLSRASYYQPMMQSMFADSGLPTDLSYLPLVESGFDPCAYSPKHAAGIWQFIAPTSARFGLRKTYWLDERRDPIQSTKAAISYLKKLYGLFGDWPLAIAAYNCGENGVAGALTKSSTANYWRLPLPRETRNYVPEFIAALVVAKKPECFGCRVPRTRPFDLDTLSINACLSLQAIAETLGLSVQQLHEMNPHILHWCSPPSAMGVRLYLPRGYGERFRNLLDQDRTKYTVSWYSYFVKTGDKLAALSKEFKVPLEALTSINDIGEMSQLTAGRKLLIPIPIHMSTGQALVARESAENRHSASSGPGPVGRDRHRVLPGETLTGIARKFHISVANICEWNNMDAGKLTEGRYLIVTAPAQGLASADSATSAALLADKIPQENDSLNETGESRTDRKQLLSFARTSRNSFADGYDKYQVRPGETLFAIARRFSISVGELVRWNRLEANNPIIFAGQNLLYKKARPGFARLFEPDTVFYRICKGDNLTSLAVSFSVTVSDIRLANSFSEKSILKMGELIRIPMAKHSSSQSAKAYSATGSSREVHL